MSKVYKIPKGEKRHRPKSFIVSEAMNLAFTFLEENREEWQFTFSETFNGYDKELPNEKTIKSEM